MTLQTTAIVQEGMVKHLMKSATQTPTRHDHGFTDNSILSVVVAMWLGCCSEVSYQVYVVLYNGKGSCFWGAELQES
jgi:hypothetical protein